MVTRIVRIALAVVLAGVVLVAVRMMVGGDSQPAERPGHWAAVERGRRHLERGRPDLAFQDVTGVRDDAPGAGEAMTVAGRALLEMRQIPMARRALERALVLQPKQPEAAKYLAAIYLASGDGPSGVAMLQRAAELDPADFRPWLAMGKARLDLGEFPEAAEAFDQARRRNPPAAEAHDARIGQVRALLLANEHDRAGVELDGLLGDRPDDAEALALAARHVQALGQADEAIAFASQSLERNPDGFDALLVRAKLSNASGDLDQALEDLERATTLNPNDLAAISLRGQVESRLGLKEKAAESSARHAALSARLTLMDDLAKEISEHPDDPEPRWKMGRAALEGGLTTLAFQCFQAALDVDPSYQPAAEELRRMEAGRAVEAVHEPAAGAGP